MTPECGCCDGVRPLTPLPIANPPGLDALAYRVGTHGSFLATMLARLSSPDHPALAELAARGGDDPAIALLDAWATVGDVLSFYQERIANEGYLRTASERRSVLELARLVGYTLRPGVAASVYLAYTLDPAGGETTVTIPAGSRAQSVPGPGQLPQSFETGEDLEARPSWTSLEVRRSRPARIDGARAESLGTLYLDGVATGVRPNDALLLVFGSDQGLQQLRKARTVTPEPAAGRTAVVLQRDDVAAFAALLERLGDFLAEARDLEARGVAGSPAAEAIDADLLGLLVDILDDTPAPTPSQLLQALEARLPRLREELALAVARNRRALATWLGADGPQVTTPGIVPAFEAAADQARELGGDGGQATGQLAVLARRARAEADPAGGTALLGLGALLGPLRLPPSQPPLGPQRLDRSVQDLFGPGSDLSAQLLVTLDPDLSGTLYTAWAAAKVTDSPLQSLQHLPVRAAPHGATAPPEVVVDSRGTVLGMREWTIDGGGSVVVRVEYSSDFGPERVRLSLTQGGTTSSSQILVEPPQDLPDIDLAPGKARLVTAQAGGASGTTITVSFQGGPEVTIEQHDLRERVVRVDLFPGREWRLQRDQTAEAEVDGRRITLQLPSFVNENGDPGDALTITVFTAPVPRNLLALDGVYDQIVPESWLAVERAGEDQPLVTRVLAADRVGRTAYGGFAEVTQLTLADDWLRDGDVLLSAIRGVTVHAQSEPLELSQEPVEDDVEGGTIELGRLYDGLQSGRWLIVSGQRADVPAEASVEAGELVMLAGVLQRADPDLPGDKVHTLLELSTPLAYRYRRDTVTVRANVIGATHGETRTEVLGSGDAGQALQTFTLRQAPLTYVAASTPSGAGSTLQVFVDEVRWAEAESLADLGPSDHGYVLRTDDDDKTSVTFGSGERGARLPSGVENVQAVYRSGLGRAGNVAAGQVSQLQTRPLGVTEVVNPLPASGGADREGLVAARRSTPLGVLALDRLVSVQDYEDFTRARAGIGKASARQVADGRRELVHLTIAGSDDISIDPTSELFQNLRLALYENGDPHQPFEVAVRELALLVISARVRIEPGRLWEPVVADVRAALLETFSFDRRQLGQDVLLSEVIAAVQGVAGVSYVDVDVLAKVPESVTPAELQQLGRTLAPPPPPRIVTELARFEESVHEVQGDVDGTETLTEIAALYGLTLEQLLRLNPGVAEAGLTAGQLLVVGRGLRPAQLALLSAAVPDTLILKEIPA
jgi:predicted phage baseplate assembly protein